MMLPIALNHWIDLLLALATVGVAWRCLTSRDLFVSVVLYVVFGLLLALVWMRLGAEDIALAEAAIGAGITGALLLDGVRQLEGGEGAGSDAGAPERVSAGLRWASAVLVLVLAGVLAAAVSAMSPYPGGLTLVVTERLTDSGVSHPVTAVLLNFRAYDTMLELVVLLLTVLAMLAVRRETDLRSLREGLPGDPVVRGLSALLVPLVVLIGWHLLFLGTYRAGGAFQAGAVLGAALVLLLLSGHRSVTALAGWSLRGSLAVGVVVFAGVGMVAPLRGRSLLEFPPGAAGALILAIEIAATLAIALALAALFAGSGAEPRERSAGSASSAP
jgi:multisubunit Na+/H+ antiporter MnhB subunit